MNTYKLGSGVSGRYTSFSEAAAALRCKPAKHRTVDADKLEQRRIKFQKAHKCKACGQPLTYIGGNIMTCTNSSCKGIKVEKNDDKGNKITTYLTSYDLLDETGTQIAQSIFAN